MQQLIPHHIAGATFLLSVHRCIFWEEQQTLILSDLHLGKTGHFRKAGIAVPQGVFKEDMQRLMTLLQTHRPQQVLVIGDMFHSTDNREHDLFLKWRNDFSNIDFHLVKGNHDILKEDWYAAAAITLHHCERRIGNFTFVHDVAECTLPENDEEYVFSGHIHPGISINGPGRQSLRFPCFYFGSRYAVLPAFSRFTGTSRIQPKRGETVYALVSPNPRRDETGGIIKI